MFISGFSQKMYLYGLVPLLFTWNFPDSLVGKESNCIVGDPGLIPGLGRYRGEEKCCPLQYSGLENSMDCIVHEAAKSRILLGNLHFAWNCHNIVNWLYPIQNVFDVKIPKVKFKKEDCSCAEPQHVVCNFWKFQFTTSYWTSKITERVTGLRNSLCSRKPILCPSPKDSYYHFVFVAYLVVDLPPFSIWI